MKLSDLNMGENNPGYIKNLDLLGHFNNGESFFQMALYRRDEKYYLYAVTFGGMGCTILDVTDPENIIFIDRFNPVDPVVYPVTTTCKIQICDDLMMLSLSSGGGAWFGNIGAGGIAGLQIYSLKNDPLKPELLSFWDCGVPNSFGVHRFMYNGGRYVHLTCDCKGYYGLIYRILDIEDVYHPVEAGRFWLPEQFVSGYPGQTFDHSAPHTPEFMDKKHFHGPPFVRDGYAYCGTNGAGFSIVDVHDITNPKLVGNLPLHPPFGGGFSGARCHTALPLPGREFCVVTNEGERFQAMDVTKINHQAQPMNTIHMIDVHDKTRPTLVAEFPYPEVPEGFPFPNFNDMGLGMQGPFGPHNIHEPMDNKPWLDQGGDKVYCCYFHAGLRVYDVSDPYYIKEIAYFIPPNPIENRFPKWKGPVIATTEDIVVDDRGNIFIDALGDGIFSLRLK